MTNNETYTARITARGVDTTVPDAPGAVDAEIILDGKVVGEVTLLPDPFGDLETWGLGWDNWADDDLRAHLESLRDPTRAIGYIVDAVRDAAE